MKCLKQRTRGEQAALNDWEERPTSRSWGQSTPPRHRKARWTRAVPQRYQYLTLQPLLDAACARTGNNVYESMEMNEAAFRKYLSSSSKTMQFCGRVGRHSPQRYAAARYTSLPIKRHSIFWPAETPDLSAVRPGSTIKLLAPSIVTMRLLIWFLSVDWTWIRPSGVTETIARWYSGRSSKRTSCVTYEAEHKV